MVQSAKVKVAKLKGGNMINEPIDITIHVAIIGFSIAALIIWAMKQEVKGTEFEKFLDEDESL